MTTISAIAARAPTDQALGRTRKVLHVLRRWPVLPVVILTLVLVCAAFAPLIAPHDPYVGQLRDERTPPMWQDGGSSKFILGTDPLGRDIFSRIVYGARISIVLVSVVVTGGVIVGTTLGVLAGYYGGWTEDIIMRFVDLNLSLPFVMIALAAAVVFGPSFPLIVTLLVLYSWSGFARQSRAETLRLKSVDYVAQARICGASDLRIMWRHVLPGLVSTTVVIMTLNVGQLILAEASLSFLGVGIPGPKPAWGSMVADGKDYISDSYWIALFPGLAIFLVVFSMNFLGDWLRDRWDPKLRQL